MLPKGMSYDQAREALSRLLTPGRSATAAAIEQSAWVREMYDDRIVWQLGDQMFSQGYTFAEDGTPTLTGQAKAVTQKTTYIPAKNGEMKAEPMDGTQLDRWLLGKIPRRLLVVPFGGPIPSAKSSLGVDLDGQWFDTETDLTGPFESLRASRERLVDWHHDDYGVPDPASRMKGAILGRIVLDDEPETDGYWADWWAKAGERRLALVAALERRATPLFGSSQAVAGAVRTAKSGHIDVWPLIRHTITTSPQNTYAVVPPLKALLDDGSLSFDEVGGPALRAAFAGLSASIPDLRSTFFSGGDRDGATFQGSGESAAKGSVELPSTETIAELRVALLGVAKRLRR